MTPVVIEEERFYRVTDGSVPHNPISPPIGDYTWVLSFSIEHKVMRIRLVDESKPFNEWESWFFKEALGDVWCKGCDHVNGRINLLGKVQILGDRANFWLPDKLPDDNYEIAQALPSSKYRLCYRRPDQRWRLRKEDEGIAGLIMVEDYCGPMNMEWFDRGSHIFIRQSVDLDSEGVAHFKSN